MIQTLAVTGYRSLRDVVVPMADLTLVTGPNGSGKSNLYKALRLMAATARGTAPAVLAAEGGLENVLWAGPETIAREVERGERPVEPTTRNEPVRLRLGFGSDELSFGVEFGLPTRAWDVDFHAQSEFFRDPVIKRECIWAGPLHRRGSVLVDRSNHVVSRKEDDGRTTVVTTELASWDTMMTRVSDPIAAPEVLLLRDLIRSWRFYDHFRTDADAPARRTPVSVRTGVLHHDGRDLAAALQTIIEERGRADLDTTVADAFPGARLSIDCSTTRFAVRFHQDGLLRPLGQAELSDGTLRYLLWTAALLSPRPPALMVLNEPETSLHPDLLPALARLIVTASAATQMWVISHSRPLIAALLGARPDARHIQLSKTLSETRIEGQTLLTKPAWNWPKR